MKFVDHLSVRVADLAASRAFYRRALEPLGARAAGCRRVVVTTSNDNLGALRFYQRRGFRLTALLPGAIAETRRLHKPQIPARGNHGIPIADELALAREL